MLTAEAAGVDTWSPCWYVDETSGDFTAFRRECVVEGAAGSRMLPRDVVPGHRVGCFGNGMIFAEGHPQAVLDAAGGAVSVGGLMSPARAQDAYAELMLSMLSAGAPVDDTRRPYWFKDQDAYVREVVKSGWEGEGGLRRLDGTVNIRCDTSLEGIALLEGFAAISKVAMGQSIVQFDVDNRVSSGYRVGYGGRSRYGRFYDKGLESGEAARGLLIRGEDQRRWGKMARVHVEEVTPEMVRRNFHKRFMPLFRAAGKVNVVAIQVLGDELWRAVDEGRLTEKEAEQLGGYLVLESSRGRRRPRPKEEGGMSRTALYRRQKLREEAGLVLGDGVLDEVEVDLGALLEQVLDTDLWGAAG